MNELSSSHFHALLISPFVWLLVCIFRYKLAYSSNYSSILDPIIENNYQLFMVERLIMFGAKTYIRTHKEDDTDLSLTDDPKKNTKIWQIPVYTWEGDEGKNCWPQNSHFSHFFTLLLQECLWWFFHYFVILANYLKNFTYYVSMNFGSCNLCSVPFMHIRFQTKDSSKELHNYTIFSQQSIQKLPKKTKKHIHSKQN